MGSGSRISALDNEAFATKLVPLLATQGTEVVHVCVRSVKSCLLGHSLNTLVCVCVCVCVCTGSFRRTAATYAAMAAHSTV